MIVNYIDQHKDEFGVESICAALSSAALSVAPSTHYAAVPRLPSARAVRDEELKVVIARVHKDNYGVSGIRKMHAQLAREPVLADTKPVARCTTQSLMKDLGLRGISRAKGPAVTGACARLLLGFRPAGRVSCYADPSGRRAGVHEFGLAGWPQLHVEDRCCSAV